MTIQTTERELQRLTAITRIHHSVSANLELKDIARILVRELVDIMGCDGCAIMLVDGSKVTVLAETGFSKAFSKMEIDTDLPPIKHILNMKQSIITGDAGSHPVASYIPYHTSVNSVICTPVIISHQVKGIVHLGSLKKNAFNREDLDFVELLAREISIVIERSFLYSEVRDKSIKDGLTRCFNRRKFDVDIAADVADTRQHGKPLSLLMVDIDWFKKYNDFHGHQRGDAVLQELVRILAANIRPWDKLYRYGGEEFAILLSGTPKEKTPTVAKRLLRVVQQTQFKGEQASQPNRKITVSIGIASLPADANRQEELIQAADTALYQAKQLGRNQFHLFEANQQ